MIRLLFTLFLRELRRPAHGRRLRIASNSIVHQLDHLLQVRLGIHGRHRGIEAELGLQLLAQVLQIGHGILQLLHFLHFLQPAVEGGHRVEAVEELLLLGILQDILGTCSVHGSAIRSHGCGGRDDA